MIVRQQGFLMRYAAFLAVPLVALLAGCYTLQGRQGEAREQARAAYAHCEELRQAGQIKTHLAAVNCAVRPVLAAYDGENYPFMDLVYVSIQARQRGADRVDNGDLSEPQYRQDVATLDARIAEEEKRRLDIMKYGNNPAPEPPERLVAGLVSFEAPATDVPAAANSSGCVPLGALRSCK